MTSLKIPAPRFSFARSAKGHSRPLSRSRVARRSAAHLLSRQHRYGAPPTTVPKLAQGAHPLVTGTLLGPRWVIEPRVSRSAGCRKHEAAFGAADTLAPTKRSGHDFAVAGPVNAAPTGQRQPSERRRPCAPHGQSRSSGMAPGAPDPARSPRRPSDRVGRGRRAMEAITRALDGRRTRFAESRGILRIDRASCTTGERTWWST